MGQNYIGMFFVMTAFDFVTLIIGLKYLTGKFLKQGYCYHKLRKTFFFSFKAVILNKLMSKHNAAWKDLSEAEFFGNLDAKFRKSVGKSDFSD